MANSSSEMEAVASGSMTEKETTSTEPAKRNNKSKTPKNSPKKTPKSYSPKKKQALDSEIGSIVVYNSTLNDVSVTCENLTLNNDNHKNPAVVKGKNAKKKEKLKKIELPSVTNNGETSSQSECLSNSVSSSVHEYFVQQITPLYAKTSSKYLENMCNHPQYEYKQIQNELQRNNSVPSAPVPTVNKTAYQYQLINNVQQRLMAQSEPNTPRYLENAMSHPLLNQTFGRSGNFKQLQSKMRHNSENGLVNNKNGDKNNIDKKFEPYILPEHAELGLKNNTLIQGVLRINPKQFQNSYVSSYDRNEQDVMIEGIKARNRALEGDIVVVQIVQKKSEETDNSDDNQKRGKVVYIKEKVHNRTCIGNLKLMLDKNRQKALFVPRDNRIPRLNIPFTSWPDNFYKNCKEYENTLFVAIIEDWNDTRFAVGKIMSSIGKAGDLITETKAILAENDLDVTPYGPQVRNLFPRLDYTIPEEEFKIREDCRELCCFSIDPSNCRDIDDAVSCKVLENGNYEIGVHISDVTHFLGENNILDELVAERATTIYLVDKAYHMLPDELCMLCSLFPGVDKLAFSVFWEITDEAEIISERFAKTVIKSCCQLAYDDAQNIIENKEGHANSFPELYNNFTYQDVNKSVITLDKIAKQLRTRRFLSGALRIDQPKVSFHLDPTSGLPESFWIYQIKDSHQLIEEFMLLANMTVAAQIYNAYPKLAFLRSHPPPSAHMLRNLAISLKPMGIELEIATAGHLQRSMLKYIGLDNEDKGRSMVLSMLCAKPMTRAKYFCADGCEDDDFHHYALNVPLYTHFTSPIRRYADIMVHRLLAASLNYRETPKWEVDKVKKIAAQCNKQKYSAKKASEMSTEFYIMKYIERNSPIMTEAVVFEVREKYIDIIIVSMSLNRRIFFNSDFPGQYNCIKHEDNHVKLAKMELTWNPVGDLPEIIQVIQVFSIIKVEMNKGDDMVKVETKLVRPE